jgi:hypothetical protein
VTKLGERFKSMKNEPQTGIAIGEVVTPNLEQNRNVFLVRKGRGLKIVSDIERLGVARDRIELPTRGFSVIMRLYAPICTN